MATIQSGPTGAIRPGAKLEVNSILGGGLLIQCYEDLALSGNPIKIALTAEEAASFVWVVSHEHQAGKPKAA